MAYKIFEAIEQFVGNYETEKLERISGLYRSQYQVIRMCEFYANSKYTGIYGQKDQMLRDRPFYNIVNYRVTLAKTATDLDIKDIQIESDRQNDQVRSMILNREAYEWMKTSGFSKTLNEMGLKRPKYGGYLIKKNETKKGELKIDVVDWTKVYTDQSDILSGPIVEKHFMSPVDIKTKDGVWENVDLVLASHRKLKLKNPRITVYEALGEFPASLYKEIEGTESSDEDEFTFTLQRYFIADIDGKKIKLYCEELKGKKIEDYYEYLEWEDSGFGLGRGVIEDSEEAQVWTNDAVVNEKNAMDLAGKVVVKTSSKKAANNILEVDNGKIFNIAANDTFEAVALNPAALGEFENQITRWKMQANDVTNSYDATTGKQPPADTPYSQTALLNQIGMKPFDYQRENWGIHLTMIFDKWIIPFVVKKIKAKHILVSEFTETELDVIDHDFAVSESNKQLINTLLSGKQINPQMQDALTQGYKQHIKKQGSKRFLEVPENYFDDISTKVTVIVTGEQKNKQAILQSLSTIMADVSKSYNPNTGKFGVLEDPILSKIFSNILELSGAGISPVSLGIPVNPKPQTTPSAPPVAAPTSQLQPAMSILSANQPQTTQ